MVEYRINIRYYAFLRPLPAPPRAGHSLANRSNQPAKVGDLRVEETRDDQLHRYVRTAKLFSDEVIVYSTALPELHDVRLVAMSQQAFTLQDSSGSMASSLRNRGSLRPPNRLLHGRRERFEMGAMHQMLLIHGLWRSHTPSQRQRSRIHSGGRD
jgi:hypothetical protein